MENIFKNKDWLTQAKEEEISREFYVKEIKDWSREDILKELKIIQQEADSDGELTREASMRAAVLQSRLDME